MTPKPLLKRVPPPEKPPVVSSSSSAGSPRGRPHPLPSVRRWLRIVGPGLVTGAADDDPSGIGTYSQAGAAFGVAQLWLALYMLPLLIAVQEMCARIGLVTGQGIAAVVRKHYSRRVLATTVGLVFIANTLNVGADLGAMAATIQLLLPGAPFFALLIAISLCVLALEVFVPYRRYAVVLKALALSLLAYVATGLIVGPRGGVLVRATIVPSIQLTPTFLMLVVGVLGTTISPYLFFWQASEEVEEADHHHVQASSVGPARHRRALLGELHLLRVDTTLGMIASEIATWFIIFTTGSVLYTHGVTQITTADQAAAALEPLVHSFPHAGLLAKALFATGILGVGLLGVPVLAGSAAYAVAEAFHWQEGLAHRATGARILWCYRRCDTHRLAPQRATHQPHHRARVLRGHQRRGCRPFAGHDPPRSKQPRDHGRIYERAALERGQRCRHARHGRRRSRTRGDPSSLSHSRGGKALGVRADTSSVEVAERVASAPCCGREGQPAHTASVQTRLSSRNGRDNSARSCATRGRIPTGRAPRRGASRKA